MKNIEHTSDGNIARRTFLKKLWTALAVIAVLEVTAVVIAFLTSGRRKGQGKLSAGLKVLGKVDNFATGSVTPFRSDRLYLVRMDDGGFLALSLHCTHLGCAVTWNKDKGVFDCPCHASSFSLNGNVISPPAPRALDIIPLKIEGGMVKADLDNPRQRKYFDASQVTYA